MNSTNDTPTVLNAVSINQVVSNSTDTDASNATNTLTAADTNAMPKVSQPAKGIYAFTVKDIDGKDVSLAEYAGKVIMIVNVASKCGFTGQYADLEKLYQDYKDRNFVVLGFPANNFLFQEPGSNSDIKRFCTLNYNVTFPMFSKISVSGDDQDPLYKYLTSKTSNSEHSGKISWNFNKFIISAEGNIVGRFGSRTGPREDKVVKLIEAELAKMIVEDPQDKPNIPVQ